MSDVRTWLEGLGLGKYAGLFEAEEVELTHLPKLTSDDLKELGLPLGPRKTVLEAARDLTADAPDKTPPAATKTIPFAERRQLTIMFCDLVGSTAISEQLDPEDLRNLMQAYQKTCGDVIARYDGHVAQYLGDGLMVYFGWPRAHEDDAARAIKAALDIVAAVGSASTAVRLQVRVGISTGPVVVGETGDGDASVPKTAVGETPNIAARLQALAGPDEVVVGPVTHRLAGGAFEYQEMGDQTLKGVVEPVRSWRVVGESAVEGRFEAQATGGLTPMVGRDHEIGLMMERWAQAESGEGQMVLVAGEAGIGKSRLCDVLRDRVAAEPYMRLRYQCTPYHTNSAFYPFADQIGRAARFHDATSPDQKIGRLRDLFALAGDDSATTLPIFASLMMIDHAVVAEVAALSPGERKEQIAEALVGQLAGLAERQPVLATFEDVQWIDPSSLDVLDMIVERLTDLRVLVVCSYRPEFEPRWIGRPDVSVLVLNRLSRRLAAAMVGHLAAGANLTPTQTDEIVARTDGIPLYVEELTRAVMERRDDAGSAIPVTLRDALTARLDALGPASEVAQTAAAIGREFTEDILLAVSTIPGPELTVALNKLIDAQVIERRGTATPPRYGFRQALVQDTAYDSLLRDRRRRLHQAIADHLEHTSPDAARHQPEILAHHFTEAGDFSRAADHWRRAADIAKARFANVEAMGHLDAGLAADQRDPAPDPARRATMMTMYGDIESRVGHLEPANTWYEKAIEVVDDPAMRSAIENHRHRPRSTRRDGAQLVFYEHGTGDETLLFVNPAIYGLAIFQPILEDLCDRFRIVTVDCRGTGGSDPLVRPFPVSEHVKDLVAIISELGGTPITGVGISRGGSHLIRLAVTQPNLLSRLVIIGGSVASLAPDTEYAPPSTFLEVLRAALAAGDTDAAWQAQVAQVFTEPGTRHAAEQLLRNGLDQPRETILNYYDADPEIDVRPLLSGLSLPTLIMHGTDDQLLPYAGAEYLAAHIKDAQLYAFEGSGHLPLFTATAAFCAALRAFVTTGKSSPAAPRGREV